MPRAFCEAFTHRSSSRHRNDKLRYGAKPRSERRHPCAWRTCSCSHTLDASPARLAGPTDRIVMKHLVVFALLAIVTLVAGKLYADPAIQSAPPVRNNDAAPLLTAPVSQRFVA